MYEIYTSFIFQYNNSNKPTPDTFASFPSNLTCMRTTSSFSVTQPRNSTVSATILLTIVTVEPKGTFFVKETQIKLLNNSMKIL